MTFVLAFYSFNLEINNSEAESYRKLRIKIPRHPYESLEQMYARVLAFAHSYEEGLEFSRGLFETREPSLWKRDLFGGTELAVEVGQVDEEKLHRALRHNPQTRHKVYFFSDDQVAQFCRSLRGSTSNWIEGISFFQIAANVLTELEPLERSSSSWSLAFVDEALYLSVDGTTIETRITPLDMWEKFQQSLADASA
jgi:uncharacterized protein YaeQ